MLGLEIATQMHSHQNPTPLKVENQVVLQDELPEIVALLHLKVRNIVRAATALRSRQRVPENGQTDTCRGKCR